MPIIHSRCLKWEGDVEYFNLIGYLIKILKILVMDLVIKHEI